LCHKLAHQSLQQQSYISFRCGPASKHPVAQKNTALDKGYRQWVEVAMAAVPASALVTARQGASSERQYPQQQHAKWLKCIGMTKDLAAPRKTPAGTHKSYLLPSTMLCALPAYKTRYSKAKTPPHPSEQTPSTHMLFRQPLLVRRHSHQHAVKHPRQKPPQEPTTAAYSHTNAMCTASSR
jgi:hypothetical protein